MSEGERMEMVTLTQQIIDEFYERRRMKIHRMLHDGKTRKVNALLHGFSIDDYCKVRCALATCSKLLNIGDTVSVRICGQTPIYFCNERCQTLWEQGRLKNAKSMMSVYKKKRAETKSFK
jgi:hypothetical protein